MKKCSKCEVAYRKIFFKEGNDVCIKCRLAESDKRGRPQWFSSLSDEQKQDVCELLKAGVSKTQIAQQCGVSYQSLKTYEEQFRKLIAEQDRKAAESEPTIKPDVELDVHVVEKRRIA